HHHATPHLPTRRSSDLSERGDLEPLAQAVQQHPGWITYAWLGMATYDASKRDFRSAYELTQRFGEAVALPRIPAGSSLEELQKRSEEHTSELQSRVELV